VERIFGPRPWVSRSEEIMGDENVTEGNPSSSAEASSGEVKDEAPAEN
jgi:hypothetical protein